MKADKITIAQRLEKTLWINTNMGSYVDYIGIDQFRAKINSLVHPETLVVGLEMEDDLDINFLAHIDDIYIESISLIKH